MKDKIESKYSYLFNSYFKGVFSLNDVYLYIYYGEGLMKKIELLKWLTDTNSITYYKYLTLLQHFLNNDCNLEEFTTAIYLLEKYL